MGNPTTFTDELFEKILDLHADGETIAAICRIEGMPKPRTFYGWLEERPELQSRFKSARRVAMDTKADEIEAIARTPELGVTEKLERVLIPWTDTERAQDKENPGSVPVRYEMVVTETKREDMLGHRKLKVEALFKLLSKWDSGRYGDKINLADAVGELLPAPTFVFQPIAPKTDE